MYEWVGMLDSCLSRLPNALVACSACPTRIRGRENDAKMYVYVLCVPTMIETYLIVLNIDRLFTYYLSNLKSFLGCFRRLTQNTINKFLVKLLRVHFASSQVRVEDGVFGSDMHTYLVACMIIYTFNRHIKFNIDIQKRECLNLFRYNYCIRVV